MQRISSTRAFSNRIIVLNVMTGRLLLLPVLGCVEEIPQKISPPKSIPLLKTRKPEQVRICPNLGYQLSQIWAIRLPLVNGPVLDNTARTISAGVGLTRCTVTGKFIIYERRVTGCKKPRYCSRQNSVTSGVQSDQSSARKPLASKTLRSGKHLARPASMLSQARGKRTCSLVSPNSEQTSFPTQSCRQIVILSNDPTTQIGGFYLADCGCSIRLQ
jgi:hypothetical protein